MGQGLVRPPPGVRLQAGDLCSLGSPSSAVGRDTGHRQGNRPHSRGRTLRPFITYTIIVVMVSFEFSWVSIYKAQGLLNLKNWIPGSPESPALPLLPPVPAFLFQSQIRACFQLPAKQMQETQALLEYVIYLYM